MKQNYAAQNFVDVEWVVCGDKVRHFFLRFKIATKIYIFIINVAIIVIGLTNNSNKKYKLILKVIKYNE